MRKRHKRNILIGATLVAAIAAAAGVGLNYMSHREDSQAAATKEAEAKLQVQVDAASKINLGEAPEYAIQAHRPSTKGNLYVVMNRSDQQIEDVWVEGAQGRSVKIWTMQPCTMYSFPRNNFTPKAVHYVDGSGLWRRGPGASDPTRIGAKALPDKDTDDSPWAMDIANCV